MKKRNEFFLISILIILFIVLILVLFILFKGNKNITGNQILKDVPKCINLITNGPSSEKIDLIIVSNNYSEQEINSLFLEKHLPWCLGFNNSLTIGFFQKEPFKTNKNLFNVWYVNQPNGYNISDNNVNYRALIREQVKTLCPFYKYEPNPSDPLTYKGDYIYILSKENHMGNEIYDIITIGVPVNADAQTLTRACPHEFGHGLGVASSTYSNSLDDEYGGTREAAGTEVLAFNCAKSESEAEQKWPISQFPDVVYSQECKGAKNLWRPTPNSLMRHGEEFNDVNKYVLLNNLRIYGTVYDPYAYYRLDRNIEDFSNNHDGSIQTVLFDNSGFNGGAAKFETNNKNYADLPDYNDIKKTFTLTAWIKPKKINLENTCYGFLGIFGTIDWNQNGNLHCQLSNGGYFQCAVLNGTGNTETISNISVPFDDQWHFVSFVYNNLSGYSQVYIDGKITASSTAKVDLNLIRMRLGSINNARFFNGMIDELRLYNESLDKDEIWNRYISEGGRKECLQTTDCPTLQKNGCEISISSDYVRSSQNYSTSTNYLCNNFKCELDYVQTAHSFCSNGCYEGKCVDSSVNNQQIDRNIELNPSTYYLSDGDNNGAYIISNNNVVFDCKGATLVGIEESTLSSPGIYPFNSLNTSFYRPRGIAILNQNYNNLTIQNCIFKNFIYGIVSLNGDNITLINNTFLDNQRSLIKSHFLNARGFIPLSQYGVFAVGNRREDGGGIYLENSFGSLVANNTARRGQNGIVMYNVSNSHVVFNNFSDNSGWGIFMWTSSFNNISNNQIDYVDKPCSIGGGCEICQLKGNRLTKGGLFDFTNAPACGCDTSGIFLYNQSNNNDFLYNSFTYGGDGFFLTGNGGGSGEKSSEPYDLPNYNYIAFNDGSYSPANAFESTHAVGNIYYGNNASWSGHGFWVGLSINQTIKMNIISHNSVAGIDGPGGTQIIQENLFESNPIGINLWTDALNPKDNRWWLKSGNHSINKNIFVSNGLAISLKDINLSSITENRIPRTNNNGIILYSSKDFSSVKFEIHENRLNNLATQSSKKLYSSFVNSTNIFVNATNNSWNLWSSSSIETSLVEFPSNSVVFVPFYNDTDEDGLSDLDDVQSCGNKITERPYNEGDNRNEDCDDGNRNSNDGCSSQCKNEDPDQDGKFGDSDNCPLVKNIDQIDKDKDGVGNACDYCDDSELPVNRRGCTLPKYSKFSSELTTDFNNIEDLREATSFTLGIDNKGIIIFDDISVNIIGMDFNSNIEIDDKLISLDSDSIPELDVPAKIQFYNINFKEPKILRDDSSCDECDILSYFEGTVAVHVPGFSEYKVEEGYVEPTDNGNGDGGGGGNGGGGGGGGGGTTPKVCNANWQCSEWSFCEDGEKIRSCNDLNKCNNTLTKPSIVETCLCTAEWVCEDWSFCENGIKTRKCVDSNNCGFELDMPHVEEVCSEKITQENLLDKILKNKIYIGLGLLSILLIILSIFLIRKIIPKIKILKEKKMIDNNIKKYLSNREIYNKKLNELYILDNKISKMTKEEYNSYLIKRKVYVNQLQEYQKYLQRSLKEINTQKVNFIYKYEKKKK